MSMENIGVAIKNPNGEIETEGVSFEVPYNYGKDKYGITLSYEEMDGLLDKWYETVMGRQALIGSSCVVDLESPDLPLFVHAASVSIDQELGLPAHVNMGVGVTTMSQVHEHRGLLFANRYDREGKWEFIRYDIQPPLREPAEVFGHAELAA